MMKITSKATLLEQKSASVKAIRTAAAFAALICLCAGLSAIFMSLPALQHNASQSYAAEEGKDAGAAAAGADGDAAYETEQSSLASRLLSDYVLDNSKPVFTNDLDTHMFTDEENDILDSVLWWQVSAAGYHTRAGAVQAARFLTLEFPYKIPYFYENGRLANHEYYRTFCDGEGRYYHKGLYLSESRISALAASEHGPGVWGEYILSYLAGREMRNGLDCSGFVTWALYNAGYDCGDVGSGFSEYDDDLSDICDLEPLTYDRLEAALPGDLLIYDGHVGMIIGIDTGSESSQDAAVSSEGAGNARTYYIAEAFDPDLHVLTYSADQVMYSKFTRIGFMGNYYGEDGLLTMMW